MYVTCMYAHYSTARKKQPSIMHTRKAAEVLRIHSSPCADIDFRFSGH